MPTDRADSSDPDLSDFLGAYVPADLMERVRAAARRADRSVSSWLRQTLRRRLDAEERVREQSDARSQ